MAPDLKKEEEYENIIKLTAAALVALMLITGCSPANTPAPSASQPAAAPAQQASQAPAATSAPADIKTAGSAWVNSSVIGSLPEQAPDLKDDFYTAVNYEWLKSAELPNGFLEAGPFIDLELKSQQEILDLVTNPAPGTEESNGDKAVRVLYNALIDMDERDKVGLDSFKESVDNIMGINGLDSLTDKLSEKGFEGVLVKIAPGIDSKDSTKWALTLSRPGLTLGDADLYKTDQTPEVQAQIDAYDKFFSQALQKLGFTEQEADAINKASWDIEKKIAEKSKGSVELNNPALLAERYNPRTIDELKEEAGAFPIAGILAVNPFGELPKYILNDPAWLKAMGELYTEENVEGVKALMLRNAINDSARYLNSDFLNLSNELLSTLNGAPANPPVELEAFKLVSTLLKDAVSKKYIDTYFDEQSKADAEQMLYDIRDAYKKRIEESTWLSDETKAKALEKADALKILVGYQDEWADYSQLVLPEEGEGANINNYMEIIANFIAEQNRKKLNAPVNSKDWYGISPYTANAFNFQQQNAIILPAGVMYASIYDPEASKEWNLGAMGALLGHEIGHTFDISGSQYDKDGNLNNWWTEEDAAAFNELTGKVADYYASIEVLPGEYVNGQNTLNETVGDLTGVTAALDVAKQNPNFNYDDFFRGYATMWRTLLSAETASDKLKYDTHAPDYLRANVTLQQFPEFYETYDIKEGDGMYLAEEDRLSVW